MRAIRWSCARRWAWRRTPASPSARIRAIPICRASAVRDVDPKLVLVGLANSALVDEGRKLGLVTAEEFFADRNYTDEGRLVSRNDPAALIRDEEHAIERVKNAIREGAVLSVTGKLVDLHPDTLCVHGDSPSALAFVSRIRQELEQDDIVIKAVGAE